MEKLTENCEKGSENVRANIDNLIHEIMDAFSHIENPSKDLREAYNHALDLRDAYLEEIVAGKPQSSESDNLRNRDELLEISKKIVGELKKGTLGRVAA